LNQQTSQPHDAARGEGGGRTEEKRFSAFFQTSECIGRYIFFFTTKTIDFGNVEELKWKYVYKNEIEE
jgi:hypothetical protein